MLTFRMLQSIEMLYALFQVMVPYFTLQLGPQCTFLYLLLEHLIYVGLNFGIRDPIDPDAVDELCCKYSVFFSIYYLIVFNLLSLFDYFVFLLFFFY